MVNVDGDAVTDSSNTPRHVLSQDSDPLTPRILLARTDCRFTKICTKYQRLEHVASVLLEFYYCQGPVDLLTVVIELYRGLAESLIVTNPRPSGLLALSRPR